MAKPPIYMSVRVLNAEEIAMVPGSVKRPCTECDSLVWVSPAGVEVLKRKPMRIVCTICLTERAAK